MNIRLHIERLVLDGLPMSAHDAAGVRSSVERKLESMLVAGELGSSIVSGGATPAVQGGTIWTSSRDSPTRLGARIGGAVYSSLGERK